MIESPPVYNFAENVTVDKHRRVRIMEPTDAPRIKEILDEDPDIRNHMGWMDDAYSIEELAERIKVMRDGRNARYVVTEDELVNGYLGLWPSWKVQFENEYDLGYFAAKPARGRGLIQQSAVALMDETARRMEVANFTVFILDTNKPSQGTAAGLGFVATDVTWESDQWGMERRYVRPA